MALVAPDPEVMEANRLNVLERVRRDIAVYERRYELPSSRLRQALNDGRLHETAEVAVWLLLLGALALLSRERPSPPQGG